MCKYWSYIKYNMLFFLPNSKMVQFVIEIKVLHCEWKKRANRNTCKVNVKWLKRKTWIEQKNVYNKWKYIFVRIEYRKIPEATNWFISLYLAFMWNLFTEQNQTSGNVNEQKKNCVRITDDFCARNNLRIRKSMYGYISSTKDARIKYTLAHSHNKEVQVSAKFST